MDKGECMKRFAHLKRPWFPLVSIGLIAILISLVITNTFWYMGTDSVQKIMADLDTLASVFQKIHQDCSILSVERGKVPINFLNIKKAGFVGNKIGPLTLAHPEKWNGPYLMRTPQVQGKNYQIVWTLDGYYIVPGDGVKLPNKKIMGVDIVINASTHMKKLVQSTGSLQYRGKALAISLKERLVECKDPIEQVLFSESE